MRKKMKCGEQFLITTNHIIGNEIGKIFVCNTDKKRYFKTVSISEKEDTFQEIGYFLHLLKNKSKEVIDELMFNVEFKEATEEEIKNAREEASWC